MVRRTGGCGVHSAVAQEPRPPSFTTPEVFSGRGCHVGDRRRRRHSAVRDRMRRDLGRAPQLASSRQGAPILKSAHATKPRAQPPRKKGGAARKRKLAYASDTAVRAPGTRFPRSHEMPRSFHAIFAAFAAYHGEDASTVRHARTTTRCADMKVHIHRRRGGTAEAGRRATLGTEPKARADAAKSGGGLLGLSTTPIPRASSSGCAKAGPSNVEIPEKRRCFADRGPAGAAVCISRHAPPHITIGEVSRTSLTNFIRKGATERHRPEGPRPIRVEVGRRRRVAMVPRRIRKLRSAADQSHPRETARSQSGLGLVVASQASDSQSRMLEADVGALNRICAKCS